MNNQIPYQTNKSALVEKIAELVENKVILLLYHYMKYNFKVIHGC